MPDHRVSVTISDPSHQLASRRKELSTRNVKVSAKNQEEALAKARKYYENMKYKVHNCNYISQLSEEDMPNKIVSRITENILKKLDEAIVDDYSKPLANNSTPNLGNVPDEEADSAAVTKARDSHDPGLADPNYPETLVQPSKANVAASDNQSHRLTPSTFNNISNPGTVKEEVESIDELSKKTLGSYVKKANRNYAKNAINFHDVVHKSGFTSADRKHFSNKMDRREQGIKRAVDRLTKEDVESIEPATNLDERDLGKPGFEFDKIAKSAGDRYGSEEAGKRVAGAILAKLRKKHPDAYSQKGKSVREEQESVKPLVENQYYNNHSDWVKAAKGKGYNIQKNAGRIGSHSLAMTASGNQKGEFNHIKGVGFLSESTELKNKE